MSKMSSEFISQIAAQAGMDGDLAFSGVGALLYALLKHLSFNLYSRIAAAIPGASLIFLKYQNSRSVRRPKPAHGFSLDDLFEGSSLHETGFLKTMLSEFAQAGFAEQDVRRFLPVVFTYLQQNLPPKIVQEIEITIPGFTEFCKRRA
jgi:uncharacterized protein (DUF2267 family)